MNESGKRPWIVRAHDRILGVLGIAAGLAVGMIVLLIASDIAFRHLGFAGFPWAIEITEYTLYTLTFLGAPWALREGAHIRLDILATNLSEPRAAALRKLVLVFGISLSLALLAFGAKIVSDAWVDDMVAMKILNYPEWLILLPIPLCGLLMFVEFIRQWVDGPDPRIDAATPQVGL